MEALRLLWQDDRGIVVSITLVLFSSIVVLGLLSSYSTLRNTVFSELSGAGSSAQVLNQTHRLPLHTSTSGVDWTNGNEWSTEGFPAKRPATCIIVSGIGN